MRCGSRVRAKNDFDLSRYFCVCSLKTSHPSQQLHHDSTAFWGPSLVTRATRNRDALATIVATRTKTRPPASSTAHFLPNFLHPPFIGFQSEYHLPACAVLNKSRFGVRHLPFARPPRTAFSSCLCVVFLEASVAREEVCACLFAPANTAFEKLVVDRALGSQTAHRLTVGV